MCLSPKTHATPPEFLVTLPFSSCVHHLSSPDTLSLNTFKITGGCRCTDPSVHFHCACSTQRHTETHTGTHRDRHRHAQTHAHTHICTSIHTYMHACHHESSSHILKTGPQRKEKGNTKESEKRKSTGCNGECCKSSTQGYVRETFAS